MPRRAAKIELPWPDKRLSKNAGSQWSAGFQRGRAAAVAKQREEAWALALEAGAAALRGHDGYDLKLTYHPPDKRRRDPQNMPGMLAGAIDGIADALKVDDSRFRVDYPREFAEVRKPGCVVFEVEGVTE